MAITLLWLPLALRAADDLNVQPAANARGRLRICLSLILILLAVATSRSMIQHWKCLQLIDALQLTLLPCSLSFRAFSNAYIVLLLGFAVVIDRATPPSHAASPF